MFVVDCQVLSEEIFVELVQSRELSWAMKKLTINLNLGSTSR